MRARQHAWLIFGTELASWLPWALATPFVIALARRYEIIRSTTIQTAAVHLAAFAAISLVAEAWFAVLQVLFNPWDFAQQLTFMDSWRYLQRYLDIQKVRFGERLQVSMDIPAGMLHAQVPNLLLQPLVENAIKHGIAKRAAGGSVRIAAACQNGSLCLRIYNDGPDSPSDWPATRTGVGISNLRTRLQILHGEESELQLAHADTGAVEVVVTLPFREA